MLCYFQRMHLEELLNTLYSNVPVDVQTLLHPKKVLFRNCADLTKELFDVLDDYTTDSGTTCISNIRLIPFRDKYYQLNLKLNNEFSI